MYFTALQAVGTNSKRCKRYVSNHCRIVPKLVCYLAATHVRINFGRKSDRIRISLWICLFYANSPLLSFAHCEPCVWGWPIISKPCTAVVLHIRNRVCAGILFGCDYTVHGRNGYWKRCCTNSPLHRKAHNVLI